MEILPGRPAAPTLPRFRLVRLAARVRPADGLIAYGLMLILLAMLVIGVISINLMASANGN